MTSVAGAYVWDRLNLYVQPCKEFQQNQNSVAKWGKGRYVHKSALIFVRLLMKSCMLKANVRG